MSKKLVALLLAISLAITSFSTTIFAAVQDEEEIPEQISAVKSVYVPGETYFVSNSTKKWVGEDNVDGDKTLGCFAPGTTNSHGRFGNLWQSMGFANYVFYNIFGEMPQFGYHCNPGELNDKVEVIGRYASNCRYIRGEYTEGVSVDNVKALLANAKQGDVLVVAPEKNCNRSGRAMVIMEVTDTFVTVYHADYKGECAVTEDSIPYDALADFHCVTLLRSADYPYPQPVPPAAVEKVTLSGNDFALNESVSVTWPVVKHTDKYKLSLLDENGGVVEQTETGSSVTSFVFNAPGTYRVAVVANNQYGDSGATYSEEIVVHNQVIVTFKDHDGTVITTQKVDYGKNAVAPNIPQRRGYQFAGWDKNLQNITAPTVITATYEIEKYIVRFYDVGGQKLLRTETVEYMGKANPPDNYTLTSGYIFSGWQISFDSDGTDYNCVDGDMSLIASEAWHNLDLPIEITITQPYRTEDGTKYTARLVIKNHAASGKNVKIIGNLAAKGGKPLKMTVVDELALAAGETVVRNVEIVYSEKASTMQFYAVGMVGNSKTGGVFSAAAGASILDNTTWGAWTDWTDQNKTGSYDAYETKTQYRYRNKVYTTATSGSLSGWTKYNTTSSTGSWSGWSKTQVSAFTNDAQKREVESRYIQPTYKTQYHYYHYCKGKSSVWTHASSGGTFHDLWVDSKLPYYTHSGGMDWYKGAACGGKYKCPYWFICDGTTYGGPGPWTRKVQTGGGYYEYRYRDTYYTHHFWQWGGWSDWSDIYTAGDETGTRTMYRYRNRSQSTEVEDTSGEVYHLSGTLDDVSEDLRGKEAIVMVYKRCNTDPTEEQMEYVGRLYIGADNSYEHWFKTIENPTSETGDFIVALGIEGADRLINVDVIEAEHPSYQVQFVADGNTFYEQTVQEGGTANAPEPPEKEGYTFVKWSETLTDVRSDKVITAVYEPKEYSVVFIDWENNTVIPQMMTYGESIEYPALEPVTGTSSRTWDKLQEGVEFVTGNMVIGSVVELNEYQVTFMVDGVAYSSQTVKHGQKATLPAEEPGVSGMTFAGWVGPCSTEHITQDAIFKPYFLYNETVAMPEAEITKSSDGTSTVELTCDTPGADIYYVIETWTEEDWSVEMEEVTGGIWDDSFSGIEGEEGGGASTPVLDGFRASATPYTGEITLAENETITFVAYANGMNESIPATETNDPDSAYYGVAVSSNTLRQYKSSVEGTVCVNIANALPEYELATVTLCIYDHRGVMIGMQPQSIEVVPGNNFVEFKDVKFTDAGIKNAKFITCKVISLLSGEAITPITDVVKFDLK